jgi:O-antigen/teichoic acid export membrane protein
MIRIFAIISFIQVITIVANIARSKLIAVLLGPSGVGVMSVVDQAIYLVAHLAALNIAYIALKFLSRAHSQGEDAFAKTYSVFLLVLMLPVCIVTLAGLSVVWWLPELLGSLMPYRFLLIPSLLSMPFIALHGYFVSVLATARKPGIASLLSLLIGLSYALTAYVGITVGGLEGLYWLTTLASALVVLVVLAYFRLAFGLTFHLGGQSPLAVLRESPDVVTFALVLYASAVADYISLFVARYVILTNFGEAEAGLLQAATGLSGVLTLILAPIVGLYLTPHLNREMPAADKLRATVQFQAIFMLVLGVLAMPLVLFPYGLLALLLSSQFGAAAQVIFLFVVGTCLTLLASVFQALLIGLDDLRVFGLIAVVSQLSFGVIAWMLAPSLGIIGVGIGLMVARLMFVMAMLVRLMRLHQFAFPRRSAVLLAYVLLALLLTGALSGGPDATDLFLIVSKLVVYAAFSLSLLWLLSPQELPPFLLGLPGGQTLAYAYSRFKRVSPPQPD